MNRRLDSELFGRCARLLVVILLSLVLVASERPSTTFAGAPGTPDDTTADEVLGQPSFAATSILYPPTPASLSQPSGAAVDSTGRLYVADTGNHRVMVWDHSATITNSQPADWFIYSITNTVPAGQGGTLLVPRGVAVDKSDNLFIADTGNNRVLVFAAPVVSGTLPSGVLGQPDFQSVYTNRGNGLIPSSSSLSSPYAMALDASGNLYVSDLSNNRVVRFAPPFIGTFGKAANLVIGQADFTHASINQGGSVSAQTLNVPLGLTVTPGGQLLVADQRNNRVLGFTPPFANGMAASLVLGQSDLTSDTNSPSADANTLNQPSGVAIDKVGELYVTDAGNHRALNYFPPLHSGMSAQRVFGQADFTQHGPNQGNPLSPPPPTPDTLYQPMGLALDAARNLYIADTTNNRLLRYDTPPAGHYVFLPLVRHNYDGLDRVYLPLVIR